MKHVFFSYPPLPFDGAAVIANADASTHRLFGRRACTSLQICSQSSHYGVDFAFLTAEQIRQQAIKDWFMFLNSSMIAWEAISAGSIAAVISKRWCREFPLRDASSPHCFHDPQPFICQLPNQHFLQTLLQCDSLPPTPPNPHHQWQGQQEYSCKLLGQLRYRLTQFTKAIVADSTSHFNA